MTATVRVRHRDAHLLADVPGFHAAITVGRWEAVAQLCAHRLADPGAAEGDLAAVAARHLPALAAAGQAGREALEVSACEGTACFTGDLHVLMAALDLYQRVEI